MLLEMIFRLLVYTLSLVCAGFSQSMPEKLARIRPIVKDVQTASKRETDSGKAEREASKRSTRDASEAARNYAGAVGQLLGGLQRVAASSGDPRSSSVGRGGNGVAPAARANDPDAGEARSGCARRNGCSTKTH